MKRILVFVILMVFAAVNCACAAEPEGGINFRLHGYTEGTLNYDAVFLDPHEGPGYHYAPASLSLPAGSRVKVLTQASDRFGNTWVLVEGDSRRVYLLQREASGNILLSCDLSSVPTEPSELISSWACMILEPVELRYGPGTSYPLTGLTLHHEDDYTWVVLMNGNWALVEYNTEYVEDAGDIVVYRRGWVSFDDLVY